MAGLAGEVAQLIVALKLDDSGFSGRLNSVTRQLQGLDKPLSQIGRGTGQLASGMGRLADRAALLAAGGLTAVVTTAASFEQAFTGVEKTVEGTEAELGELEDTIREMARTMPVAFEELAAIGEAGGALGIAREDLDEFIDVVSRLAVSTDLSADQAATALGQLGNVLGLSGDDFEAFSDSLVALGNAGASTEGQIIDIAARFGAAGRSAGISNEAILALSSTVASMGIEAEAGGSSLSRLFNSVATNIGTANEKAVAFADGLGLSLGEFRDAWANDAEGVFRDLLGYVNELDQFEAAAFLKEIGITNTRDVNTIRLLAQGVDEYTRQLEVSTDASGELREESDKFFNTTAGQWQILQNNVRDAAAVIGEELLPIVNDVMRDMVAWLNDPATQRGLRDFAKDLATGVRDLAEGLKNADFSGLIGTMKGAADVAKGAFAAFNALPEPVKQLALAAIVGNKVTGGAVGEIAKGLGNILMGGLKLAIPALSRGITPFNPLFVKEVGLGVRQGPDIPPTGGKGGGWGNLLKLGAGILGLSLIQTSSQATTPAMEQQSEITRLWKEGLLTDEQYQTLFKLAYDGVDVSDRLASLTEGLPAAKPTTVTLLSPEERRSLLDLMPPRKAMSNLTLGGDALLTTNELLERLGKTTEIGLAGVGTSFQQGLMTGLDPLGDTAVALLARAEDPKAPPVMAEIQGHIAGLEEIQATYLAQGDIKLASKVQNNIDTLHSLIGTVDLVKAVEERTAAATERVAAKNFSPLVKVDNNISIPVSVSARVIAERVYEQTLTTNGRLDDISVF